MSNKQLQLAVIIASTRKGRFAPVVGNWFIEQARHRKDLTVDVIDLADTPLPTTFPSPRTAEVAAFAERIDNADAFVVVVPEYNHSFPAPLKNAIDLLKDEWRVKPVAFVSYGGISGGLRAVEQLRLVFAELHAVTIRDTVSFHGVHGRFDEIGNPIDAAGVNAATETMLGQLVWWAAMLREGRQRLATVAAM